MTNDNDRPDLYGQYGGFTTRLVAWIIDQLIIGVLLGVFGWVLSFVSDTFDINELLGLQEWTDVIMAIIVIVGTLVISGSYNVGLWLLAGQTPGKRIMGLRIVLTDGQRLTFWKAVIRWISYAISAILFLGFLWVLVDNRRQGFHDKLAHTLVVYTWPEKEEWEIQPVKERVEHRREKRKMKEEGTQPAD